VRDLLDTGDAVRALLRQAIRAYEDDPVAVPLLEQHLRRQDEPLRVAVAGKVKAGKSTLLNAVIGEEIAPTDAGECTRVVTWYRHGLTPRVVLHPVQGAPRPLPLRRVGGRLVFALGGRAPDAVERLVVEWPATNLRDLTLIDTPGIASLSEEVSARTTAFLTPQDAPSQADAVLYLMRHLHASDVGFLESFRDTAAGRFGTASTIAVLSRADEVGAGRIDSLISARSVAERYRRDETLRSLCLTVVPVAGLLAQTASTLRHAEFTVLRRLADLERAERERLLLSVDRFRHGGTSVDVPPEARAELVARFGLFGIRLSVALIRGGVKDPTALAQELTRRSGLQDLLGLLRVQFHQRAGQLKTRTALLAVEQLLRERPRQGTAEIAASLERIVAGAHELRELRLLASVRAPGAGMPRGLADEAERLLGGHGCAPQDRLGLPRDAPVSELRACALEAVVRWRTIAESPMSSRATAEAAHAVVRSCEGVLAGTAAGKAPSPRLLTPEPGVGAR
jgi:hypothetical protein